MEPDRATVALVERESTVTDVVHMEVSRREGEPRVSIFFRPVLSSAHTGIYKSLNNVFVAPSLLPPAYHTVQLKHNGKFAHRKTPHYERNESFDGEAVSQSRGFEEYLHLKSQHDEYETIRGSGCPLARKRREEEEEREVTVREVEDETV